MINTVKATLLSLAVAGSMFFASAQKTGTTTPPATPTVPAATVGCKVAAVNVNTALKADLVKIPGIGAKVADAIIAARPFKDEADLVKKVKGIGKKNIVTFRPCFLYK